MGVQWIKQLILYLKINPDSKENILFILIHELTHLLDLKYLKKLLKIFDI